MAQDTLKNEYAKLVRDLETNKGDDWVKEREIKCLDLFRKAAESVPAYRKFLKKNKVVAQNIKTWKDFQSVPLIGKKNYISVYPYNELYWDGLLDKPLVYTSTSGSTGKPFYFARDNKLDWQHSIISELFVKRRMTSKDTPALFIICFGMGVWIGGLINFKSMDILVHRQRYPISIITPGININEILNILKNIAPNYKQVIMAGYPPLVKDVIDEALKIGIEMDKLNLRLLFAAESISEEFRDYIAEKGKVKDLYQDIINIYGSAELGAMAQESLVCTLIRRLANGDSNLAKAVFRQTEKFPTLAQFIPRFTSFEQIRNKIVVTGDSAIPLIRYDIGDNGGVISYDEMCNKLSRLGINLENEIKEKKLKQVYKLPFVSFYGLNVYPEWIKPALYKLEIRDVLTGKFMLATKLNRNKDQILEINIEMRSGKRATSRLVARVLESVMTSLMKRSSEYREICNQLKKRAIPKLVFWPYHHGAYFCSGVKQKWVEKN